MEIKDIKKLLKKQEELDFINPELADVHKAKGNEHFKKGEFPQALEEYSIAIRRNPESAPLYCNRCFAYTKLMDLGSAEKDADKGIEIDPNFVKLYLRKGNVQNIMKAYHKALDTYDTGLKIEPDNKDL